MPLTSHTATKGYLLGLFLFSLPIFMLIQWDISPWLATKVNAAAKSAGLELSYKQLSLSGFGVHFQELKVSQGDKLSIALDEFDASLSFSSLFSGTLAADVELVWLANPVSFTIAQSDEHILLSHLNSHIDLLNLFDIQQNMALRASGIMRAKGEVSIHKTSMLPTMVNLSVNWSQAKAGLTSPEFALGDYQLQLKSNEEEKQPWIWDISGGEAIALNGKGNIALLAENIQRSNITGVVDIAVDPSNATLSMMIQAFTGSSKAKLRISGNLSSPRTQVVH
ncbi:MAG: hypothetical protein R8M45_01875 [Ghiorsea sp.]